MSAKPLSALPRRVRRRLRGPAAPRPWDAAFEHGRQTCPPGLVLAPPDFVGIGAQKAGTTWWFDRITTHPAVYHHAAYDKERHFLAKRGSAGTPYPADIAADYASWFPRPEGSFSGEWTPGYLYYHWVAELLALVAPAAKVLVLLRDPVERYRSGIVQGVGAPGAEQPSHVEHAFQRGLYAAQLRRWRDHLPPEQMLVLQYERCCAAPDVELRRTFDFLGLPDVPLPAGAGRGRSSGPKPNLSPERVNLLQRLYEADVAELVAEHPAIDLDLWPNFSHLGSKGTR